MSDQVKINQFNIEYPDGTSVPAAIELPISAIDGLQAVLSTLQAALATGGRSLGAFDNYQKVVDFLLSVDSVAIATVGSAIYLKGSATPDLWIEETGLDFQNFTYTTDENFIQYIKDGGRIGRFKVSLSEVDLSGYVSKMIGTPDSGATRGFLYGLDSDGIEQKLFPIQIQANANTIAYRDANGNFYVGTPTLAYHCANKGYVDDNFIAKTAANTGQRRAHTLTENGNYEAMIIDYITTPYSLVRRSGTQIKTITPAAADDVPNKGYVDDNFLAKKTGITSEVIITQKADGTTDHLAYSTEVDALHIVRRRADGDILVPTTPSTGNSAVNQLYVNGKLAALTLDEDNGLSELSFTTTLPGGATCAQTVKLPDSVSTDLYSCITNTQFLQFDNIYATGGIQALNGFTVGSRGLTSKTTYKEDRISRALLAPTGVTACHLLFPDSPGTIATEEYCAGASTRLYRHVFTVAEKTFHIISTESQPYTSSSTNIKDTFVSGYTDNGATAILTIDISSGGYMTIIYANAMGATDMGYNLADGDYPLNNDVVTPL